MTITRASIALFALLLVSACSSGSSDPGGTPPGGVDRCEGKCDGFGGLEPVLSPESLVQCELSSSPPYAVSCEYIGVPSSFPVPVDVEVLAVGRNFRDADGNLQSGRTAEATPVEPGSFTLLGDLRPDELPVTVLINAETRVSTFIGQRVNSDTGSSLREITYLQNLEAGDATPDLPLPYELWRVRLFAPEGQTARFVTTGPERFDITPWETFGFDSIVDLQVDHGNITNEPVDLVLPVTLGQESLAGSMTYCEGGCNEVNFALTGPGVYLLSAAGAERVDVAPTTDAGVDGGFRSDAGFDPDGGFDPAA
ncbi:MAG: hypothetical protein AAF449_13365 [Myxococcota bacterium]